MGKGHHRRPSNISAEKYACNYDRIFKGVEPEIPTATQAECTAIVKYVPPDLTKMNHPTACKYLVEGMRVKVLCRADNNTKGWDNSWVKEMDSFIGKSFTIGKLYVDSSWGVTFVEDHSTQWQFPAFCLQIIEPGQENNNERR